jgi:hypothetical protein
LYIHSLGARRALLVGVLGVAAVVVLAQAPLTTTAYADGAKRLRASAVQPAADEASSDDARVADFTRRAALRYQQLLPTGRRPNGRRWRAFRNAAQRDVRVVRSLRPSTATGRAQLSCAIGALRSIVSGSTAGRAAYIGKRRNTERRALRRVRAAVGHLRRCARMRPSPAPPTQLPATSPAPPPQPATPPAPPVSGPPPTTVPSSPPAAPASVQITRFEGIVDVVGPLFPFNAPPAGLITGCAPGLGRLSVWFATSGVDPADLTVVWSASGQELLRLGVLATDPVSGESISRIALASGAPLANLIYTATVELGGTILDESTVTVSC